MVLICAQTDSVLSAHDVKILIQKKNLWFTITLWTIINERMGGGKVRRIQNTFVFKPIKKLRCEKCYCITCFNHHIIISLYVIQQNVKVLQHQVAKIRRIINLAFKERVHCLWKILNFLPFNLIYAWTIIFSLSQILIFISFLKFQRQKASFLCILRTF